METTEARRDLQQQETSLPFSTLLETRPLRELFRQPDNDVWGFGILKAQDVLPKPTPDMVLPRNAPLEIAKLPREMPSFAYGVEEGEVQEAKAAVVQSYGTRKRWWAQVKFLEF